MTAAEKLRLAQEVIELVEELFPTDRHDGQAEALMIAIQAMTSTAYPKVLLGVE